MKKKYSDKEIEELELKKSELTKKIKSLRRAGARKQENEKKKQRNHIMYLFGGELEKNYKEVYGQDFFRLSDNEDENKTLNNEQVELIVAVRQFWEKMKAETSSENTPPPVPHQETTPPPKPRTEKGQKQEKEELAPWEKSMDWLEDKN